MICNSKFIANDNILPTNCKYFKEEIISEVLTIPCPKPDMERILKTLIQAEIVDMKIIETEVGYSNEGQNLTGYKLVVELNIREKISYVADECRQSVHGANFESIKSIFIVIPKTLNGVDTYELFQEGKILVTPYIEAVTARMLDKRTIHKCIMLFLDTTIC